MRAFHVGRALQKIGRPTLVVIGADEVQPEAKARTAQEYDVAREIRVVRSAPRSFVSRGVSIFDPAFTNIHGLVAEAQDEAWLTEFQKQFDLTWFCKLRTANYLAKANWPRSVVDVDDLPSTMERSYLKTSPDLRTRLKSSIRIFELSRHETRLGRRFDVLGVCSENDRSLFDPRLPIHVIPNGFERPVTLPVRQLSQPPRIGFMGLYSYSPNLEGVRWFIRNCWDQVKSEFPGVRLRLVGEESGRPAEAGRSLGGRPRMG